MGIIEKEPVSFYGRSGREYHFKAYSLDTEIKNCEAVYIFTKRVSTKREVKDYIRLYVGETNNIETVFRDHENSPCLKQHGADSICAHFDKNESSRRKKVSDIIDGAGGRPPCNVNDPDE